MEGILEGRYFSEECSSLREELEKEYSKQRENSSLKSPKVARRTHIFASRFLLIVRQAVLDAEE